MGLIPVTLNTLAYYMPLVGGWNGSRMMELGAQQLMLHDEFPGDPPAKPWFEGRGVLHTSIDLNGLYGSIALDLTQPGLMPEWHGIFNVVTDFGTSEHCGTSIHDLWQVRKNCHAWLRVGGLMIWENPRTGSWPGHGNHWYNVEHPMAIARYARYRLLCAREVLCSTQSDAPCWDVVSVFQKQVEAPFLPFEVFEEICNRTVFKQ